MREKGFLASQFQGTQSIMVGKAQGQEFEATYDITSTAKSRETNAGA